MGIRKIFLFIFVYAFPLLLSAQAERFSEIREFTKATTDSFFRKGKVPAILVGYFYKGKKSFYTVGYANVDAKQQFDQETVFEAGSITKTFTAYIVEAVLLQHKIADTVSIAKYLPDSVAANPAVKKISFLQLLNHTSGLPRLPENMNISPDDLDPYKQYDVNQLFGYLKAAVTKPDGKSNYSNLGMGLAGVLAERISDMSYDSLLEKLIFRAFGLLKESEPFHNPNLIASKGYLDSVPVGYWNMNALTAAGGLKCTAKEMVSYLSFMSVPGNKEVASIINNLLIPTATVNPRVKIGKGWHIFITGKEKDIYWHNGGTYGFSTFAAFLKDENAGVIVVANKFNTNAISDALGMAIMKKMLE